MQPKVALATFPATPMSLEHRLGQVLHRGRCQPAAGEEEEGFLLLPARFSSLTEPVPSAEVVSHELGGHGRQQTWVSLELGLGVGGYLPGLGPLRLLQRSRDLLFFCVFPESKPFHHKAGHGAGGCLLRGSPVRLSGPLGGMPPWDASRSRGGATVSR